MMKPVHSWRRRQFSRSLRVEALEQRQMLSVAPVLDTIADETLLSGAPLHVALAASDADGDALTFSAEITSTTLGDPNDISADVTAGNRSMRISVQDFGDMEFELFEQRAPRTTGRIIELAQSGFYDGLTFHRVVKDFMIQGGDPIGNGTGGSGVDFDDEFHPELQHVGSGLLSMAKSSDDTNDSQFFVTAVSTRYLDFNHSVFGRLTEGDDVRQAIENVPVEMNDAGTEVSKPVTPLVMDSVEIYFDNDSGVLVLAAAEGVTGAADVKITVTDTEGKTDEQTFHVTIQADTSNGNPYLLPITAPHTTVDEEVVFDLPAYDIEGDLMYFDGIVYPSNPDIEILVDHGTGATTVTPGNGLIGVHGVFVGVQAESGSDWDTQAVPVFIHPLAPTAVELLAVSDTGISQSDRITSLDNNGADTLQFRVSGVTSGNQVTLYADGVAIGQAVASGGSVDIVTNGTVPLSDGNHAITAVQTLLNQSYTIGNFSDTVDLDSPGSSPLQISVDTVAPQFTSTPVANADEGVLYTYDAQTDDEPTGQVTYELSTSPSGMVIDEDTGQVAWTPSAGQGPVVPVVIEAIDRAGNPRQQSFDVVLGQPEAVDFMELQDRAVFDNDQLLFTTVRGGRLTVDAQFSNADGDINIYLLDADANLVDGSSTTSDYERIDVLVDASETYQLLFSGDNLHVTVRVANMLVDDGSKLTVYGTAEDDTFGVTAGNPHQVVVNGVSYDGINPAVTEVIRIEGGGGNDTATVTGTDGGDSAVFGANEGVLVGDGYQVELAGMATIAVDGGGGTDDAKLYDSAGNDAYVAGVDSCVLSGDGFSNTMVGFGSVQAFATAGGNDEAEITDGPSDDSYYATAIEAAISGGGLYRRVKHFDIVNCNASAGGHDTASLYDSAGNDNLIGAPGFGLLYGTGFSNRVTGFDAVKSVANGGGNDAAKLYDSAGDDLLVGSPTEVAISGTGFSIRVESFDKVEAYAVGGHDEARLSGSPDDDVFYATPAEAAISGPGFYVRVKSFDEVRADASGGGEDNASLYDSPTRDTFIATPTFASLSGTGFYSEATNFDTVTAYGSPGDYDVARLYDSPGDDTFWTTPTFGALLGDGFFNQATGFEGVNAYTFAGGHDVGKFYDSPGDDTFYGTPEESMVWGPGFYHRAKGFQRVDAFGTAGGNDTALLFDSPGDDGFYGTPTESAIYGTGFFNRAKFFDEVYAETSGDGDDNAYLYDSPEADLLEADTDWAQISSAAVDFLCKVTAFDYVQATSTSTGDTKDVPELSLLGFDLDLIGDWQDAPP